VLQRDYDFAHRATNYGHWFGTNDPYPVPTTPPPPLPTRLQVGWEWTYEPYILGYKPCLPKYGLEFVYYGNDKISFIYNLAAWGARFVVMPEGFITHKWHPRNEWSQAERLANQPFVLTAFDKFADRVRASSPSEGCYGVEKHVRR
jgi:hypothetical protein